MWALFKGTQKISKEYPHKIQAVIDAFEQGLAVSGRQGRVWLLVDIRKV